MTSKGTLLLIEDDAGIRESLELGLGFEGFRVVSASNGSDGLRLLNEHEVDTVILDVLLPGSDGYTILEEVRSHQAKRHVPVLMLTALDEVENRVRGLQKGADDYLVKPFALAELVARLEAIRRRAAPQQSDLRFATLRLYPERMEAWRDNRPLTLSPKEFLLLLVLVENAERILSKTALMQRVWGEETEPNTLEVHLSSLRRALGEPPLIRTVRGYGYVLKGS